MKVYHKVFGSDFIMSFIAVCIVGGLVYTGVSALSATHPSSFQAAFNIQKA